MNRHQVLTGAANSFDNSVSIGSVENNHFTVYGSGFNIVILSSNFDRVQIISGKNFSNAPLRCVECTLDTGKIAAAYGNKLYIFEPTPSAKKATHNIHYKWVQVGSIELKSDIISISWNNEGNRLLIGCSLGSIQIWSYNSNTLNAFDTNIKLDNKTNFSDNYLSTSGRNESVKFSIAEESDNHSSNAHSTHNDNSENNNHETTSLPIFRKIWEKKLPNPVKCLKYSPDGSLFASYGENDRLVKIWHEVKSFIFLLNPNAEPAKDTQIDYNFVYLAHPRAVTSISWRQTSKFMPRGMISNSIITCCKDNICRIWAETVLPDDGLLYSNQDESTYISLAKSARHKRKLLNKLHKMRISSHLPHLPHIRSKEGSYQIHKENLGQSYPLQNVTHSQFNLNSINNETHHHHPHPHSQPHHLHPHHQNPNLSSHYHHHNFSSHLLSSLNNPFSSFLSLHSSNNNTSNQNSLSSNNIPRLASSNSNQTSASLTNNNLTVNDPNKLMHGSLSCHELHLKQNYNINPTNPIPAGFHFHLAGFIDPDAGIPLNLLPNIKQSKDTNFIVHWMNNKDFNFTLAAELFSREVYEKLRKAKSEKLSRRSSQEDEMSETQNKDDSSDGETHARSNSNENISKTPIRSKGKNEFDDFDLLNFDDDSKNLFSGHTIDQKLDAMVKDWYSSHDVLFCIHPIDGSILIWLVDWLDEYMPGSYRQAQVSFHAKLPNSIPVGDAMSLSNSVFLYTEPVKAQTRYSDSINLDKSYDDVKNYDEDQEDEEEKFFLPGVVNMVSKHSNGTLNLWKLQFQETSKYQSLINVSHMSRICGHRFKVNDITSHPILPFLLTNSVNVLNIIDDDVKSDSSFGNELKTQRSMDKTSDSLIDEDAFQKGLIIWGVESIGPLSKTGGIYELARIDSSKPNAFQNIAWFPCFLPSSTLGNSSSSPSTLFASTESSCITIYQAVFDARTLLQDLQNQSPDPKRKETSQSEKLIKMTSITSTTSNTTDIPFDSFNVVSIQSTARPGCIIELDKLADSNGTWPKADLFHLYQESLILNPDKSSQRQPPQNKLNYFSETYYLVLLEKKRTPARKIIERVHMWKINISSAPMMNEESGANPDNGANIKFQPDLYMRLNNNGASSPSSNDMSYLNDMKSPDSLLAGSFQKNRLSITSTRVCNQVLELPDDVSVICADSAAADLSSSAMFSLSKVPYLFSTACSDGIIRFWSCKKRENETNQLDQSESEQFEFFEWEFNSTLSPSGLLKSNNSVEGVLSQVKIDSYPLAISCAYNSRFAVAFKKNIESDSKTEDEKTFTNFVVRIYECESTGGSEWKLEDCIYLKNIVLPELDSGINFDYIYGKQKPIRPAKSCHSFKSIVFGSSMSNPTTLSTVPSRDSLNASSNPLNESAKIPEIPSTAAKNSVKKQYSINRGSLRAADSPDGLNGVNKHIIKLDWASTENGSHILTVGLGNQIFVYSCVTKDSSHEDKPDAQDTSCDSLVKWLQFRTFELDSADDMQALPTQIKWVREGLLVVGLNTEMQVFSQWTSLNPSEHQSLLNENNFEMNDSENRSKGFLVPKNHSVLDLNKLNKLSKENYSNKTSVSKNTKLIDENQMLEIIQGSGLFMQAKRAWPVLPQYHPKQLLELMNSGKINRVKAILMHLTRCIIDFEINQKNKINSRKKLKRKMSVTSESQIIELEEPVLNYIEVENIPPLPLFALFAADHETYNENDDITRTKSDLPSPTNKQQDYEFFDLNKKRTVNNDSELDIDITDLGGFEDDEEKERKAKLLEKKLNKEKNEFKKILLSDKGVYFNARVCKLLTEYLTCVQLCGLTSIDQMYLVALADTVANVKCDVNFSQDEDVFSKREFINDNQTNETNISPIVDNCGLKFLLALRSYNYLMRTLPSANRVKLKDLGLGTANFAWAFHSESEQELLNSILQACNSEQTSGDNKLTSIEKIYWSDLKQYGVGWWLKNLTLLRQLIEQVAKCAFQEKSDPLDAALFYLAMKKKGVLWGLFKTVKDTRMTDFFKNDFNEAKWQTAALKNAFVLLGKQRFEHAAAFFLLAGRLKDAVEVCLRNLKDIQLALVIVRLYETNFDDLNNYLKTILSVEVLGYTLVAEQSPAYSDIKKSSSFGTLSKLPEARYVSPDPFLRSMAYWFIKDYKQSLFTLYDIDIGNSKKYKSIDSALSHFGTLGNTKDSIIAHVFNFYTFLKHHPLILRLQSIEDTKLDSDSKNLTKMTSKKQKSQHVTPIERRLHFISAYYHLINGCPLLTLDILSKLPKYIINSQDEEKTDEAGSKLDSADSAFHSNPFASDSTDNSSKKVEKSEDFDWSTPSGFDFNKRFEEDKLELDLSLGDSDEEDEDKDESDKNKKTEIVESKNEVNKPKPITENTNKTEDNEAPPENAVVDILTQQIKFISCLKILIEEMSTLSTGFEVVGGQLRYYMYYWLERETQLLRELGDFKSDNTLSLESQEENYQDENSLLESAEFNNTLEPSLLHEQVLKDQKTFQAKIYRMNKRKEWLRSNELLLRTFLCYCSLHSANSAGLNSVKMELVLLMQELVEDRSMKQLLSPVPISTTIPLLSASIASSKNVVAGPIRMLKSMVNDILSTIGGIHSIPSILNHSVIMSTLKELSVSLSSCIYQCLCDSDVFTVSDNDVGTGMQGFSRNILYKSTYLMSGLKKNSKPYQTQQNKVHTSPKNWPGVSNLTKLIEREQDIEAPKLKILLFESLVSVYCSVLLNAFVFYDCSTLWRLLPKQWNDQLWHRLFGGGCLTEYKYKTQANVNLDDESAKQRLKVITKLGHKVNFQSSAQLAGSPPTQQNKNYLNSFEEKVYVREHFVAPDISMINFFFTKPEMDENTKLPNEKDDSEDESLDAPKEDDVLDDDPELTYGKRYFEHVNPKSYSWCLMRYAIIKYTINNITSFLSVLGIELQELAMLSPLVHQVLKTFEHWSEILIAQLNAFNGPPDDYIPGCNVNTNFSLNGPKILKYQSMLDPANTPFINEKSTFEVRRLWHFLVTKKILHDVFIRYIFKKKSTPLATSAPVDTTKRPDATPNGAADSHADSSYKIVHKDQESIYGFCLNERDKNMLALCTNKEIIEMDMRNLLVKNPPIDDECEMDILALQGSRAGYEQDVYVIGGSMVDTTVSYNPEIQQKLQQNAPAARSNSLSNVILKRSSKEVRRLASHPTLPYYLSGTNESVVKLWHWGSNDALSSYKQSEKSSSAKITKLMFNTHGNKFGVSDMDGFLHLYQLLGCSFKPYLTLKCHKVINDFLFIDSSSILMTIGTSNDSYVLSFWDTLLPPNKSLIKSYKEADIPSGTCAAYSPLNHFVYCGNRKGEINIYDIRTHRKIQKFVAHESSVKAIALDPDEYYIATGSSEGNVKVWNLKTLDVYQTYHNEHSKSSLIRNFNSGVNQLYFTNENQLLSCGADGTLVIRNFTN